MRVCSVHGRGCGPLCNWLCPICGAFSQQILGMGYAMLHHAHCLLQPLLWPAPPPTHLLTRSPTRPAVSDYVEMFRVHGDIHSFLYTGSPAMHSHVLALVVQVRRLRQAGLAACMDCPAALLTSQTQSPITALLQHVPCTTACRTCPPIRRSASDRGARATAPSVAWASCRTCAWRCSGAGTTPCPTPAASRWVLAGP